MPFIINCRTSVSLNPTCGSFNVYDPRVQSNPNISEDGVAREIFKRGCDGLQVKGLMTKQSKTLRLNRENVGL